MTTTDSSTRSTYSTQRLQLTAEPINSTVSRLEPTQTRMNYAVDYDAALTFDHTIVDQYNCTCIPALTNVKSQHLFKASRMMWGQLQLEDNLFLLFCIVY